MNKHLKYIISMLICACVMSVGFLLYASVVSGIDLEYIGDVLRNAGASPKTAELLISILSFLLPTLSLTAVGVITYISYRKVNFSSCALKEKAFTAIEATVSCAFYFFWGFFGFIVGIFNVIRILFKSGFSAGLTEFVYQGRGFLSYVLGWLALPIVISVFAILVSDFIKFIRSKLERKKALCIIIELITSVVAVGAIFILSFFAFRFLFLGTDNYFVRNAG